ncbi:MAG: RagB/SusD family nutrient uptake outer membrane protein, partial [Cyclobacteriaceae bacterium]
MNTTSAIKLVFFTLTFFIFSCESLEENPVDIISPNGQFSTTNDVQAAINGGYSAISSEEFWGRKLTLSLMLRSDMVDIGDQTTSGRRIQVNNFQMDS